MKIELLDRTRSEGWQKSDSIEIVVWRKAVPFFQNPRGVMLHRVRSVETLIHKLEHPEVYSKGFRQPYNAIRYWCGNTTLARGTAGWTEFPDDQHVLCERCEQIAVKAGYPPADELAGRHVHVGRAKAFRTCCVGK